jgi:quercetin dioxygenase-like cupin family protein
MMQGFMMSLLPFFVALSWLYQDLPSAFPREGAKLLIENERVMVWDVTLPKGRPTPMDRHRYDVVAVDLADATGQSTAPDGSTRAAATKAGQVLFQPRGVTHREEGTSDVPRHLVAVELKDVSISPISNNTGVVNAFPRENTTKLLENDRVIVWEYTWTPGKPSATHFHDKDAVVVFMGEGLLRVATPDGKSQTNPRSYGQALMSPRGVTHTEELVSGKAKSIVIELK